MRNGSVALIIAGLALVFAPQLSHAIKFTNQFVEFELPSGWQCSLEGAEWVCQNTNADKKREAIIVLAAKIKGDQDSLDQYLEYLKKEKGFTSVQGEAVTSKPSYAKMVNINDHSWVDSLHLNSEIPNFFTRYFATVKLDIGVLVTYSVHKDKYKEYIDQFENLAKTLVVFRKPGAINTSGNQSLFEAVKIPDSVSVGTVFPNEDDQEKNKKNSSEDDSFPIEYLLLGGALVGFIIWRRKNRG